MGKLQLKDLYIGKVDGYNEYLEYGEDICNNLFFEYPNLDIKKLLDGSIYYICGDKGTGKTMLLKHVESVVLKEPYVHSSEFIRFKKDVDEDQRNQVKRAGVPQAPFEEIIESEIPSDNSIDCVLAWQVYLIKVIINRLCKSEFGVFDRTDSKWSKLNNLLNAVYDDSNDSSFIKRILPKIKRGAIEINPKFAKLNLELEWLDGNKKMVSFNSVGKRIVDLYSGLIGVENTIYVFIDELELSLKQTKKYERDITLIRDLIFAVQYLNEISKLKRFNVRIITAIRNEVYKNVKAKGLEINKTIHDFGTEITWIQKGGDIKNHPLLKMLEKRFQYSEELAGLPNSQDVWKEYFLQTIGRAEVPICNYILNQTWFRPRDIVRFFSIIQSLDGDKTYIDQATFDIVKQKYSEESWAEFEEVLTVKYSDEEVEGIKQSLTGLSLPFASSDFIAQIDGKADTFEEVEKLKNSNKKPTQILRDLYDMGVLGNYGSLPRFSFKGDKDIDPMMPLTFHYPLIRYFRASIKAFEQKLEVYR